jgi:stearoyl-CoA desaturase (delta-9 desaturase)
MVTKEWAAIHRKHHAKCETEDPHSPQIHGINKVLWTGVFLYVKEARNRETIQRYGHGTPDDWASATVLALPKLGIVIMLAADILLFGVWPGVLIWGVQMVWIPSGRPASSTASGTSGATATTTVPTPPPTSFRGAS